MTRPLIFSVLAASVLLLCSCDAFRRLAGRPTSKDIEAKRELIRQEEAAHQARLDSLKLVEKALADSLEMIDRIHRSGEMFLSLSSLRGASAASLSHRYYIMAGAFANAENASWMASRIAARGYEVVRIPYGNGFTAVGLAGEDSLTGMWEALQKVKTESFCPKDVWILVNE